jgi:Uma2 family endonuclease
MTVNDYLGGEETMRRRELVWGVVREPPSPFFSHQAIVMRIAVLLSLHARDLNLGVVVGAPLDVILDEDKALIVQPDVFFVSNERMAIIRDHVWGAPDLVVEVASPGTARYDSVTKVEWYRMYGVRECWLVDPRSQAITAIDLQSTSASAATTSTGNEQVRSVVLPMFANRAEEFFE